MGKKSKVTKLNDGAVLLHSKVPQNETYYIVDGKYYTQVYARDTYQTYQIIIYG